MRERTGRERTSGWQQDQDGKQDSSPRVFEPALGRSIQQQKRRGVWPPRVQDVQRGDQMAYGETQQDVDVRLSADDIRDRLKTLKSRGGNRHMRAVSANGVLENEQINDIDVDDPRSIVRSETVSPTSHQQSKFLGDDRPIRPMRHSSYAEAGHHHDARFKSSSAPAATNSQMAENDWVEEMPMHITKRTNV